MHLYNVISIVLEKEESPFTQNIKQDSFQREAGDQEDPIIRHSIPFSPCQTQGELNRLDLVSPSLMPLVF